MGLICEKLRPTRFPSAARPNTISYSRRMRSGDSRYPFRRDAFAQCNRQFATNGSFIRNKACAPRSICFVVLQCHCNRERQTVVRISCFAPVRTDIDTSPAGALWRLEIRASQRGTEARHSEQAVANALASPRRLARQSNGSVCSHASRI